MLRGNHKEVTLRFPKRSSIPGANLESWRYCASTARGARLHIQRRFRRSLVENRCARFHDSHRHFLEATGTSASRGGYLFCHAGAPSAARSRRAEAGQSALTSATTFFAMRALMADGMAADGSPHGACQNLPHAIRSCPSSAVRAWPASGVSFALRPSHARMTK